MEQLAFYNLPDVLLLVLTLYNKLFPLARHLVVAAAEWDPAVDVCPPTFSHGH